MDFFSLDLLFLISLASTAGMFALIWLIQLVHYPSFVQIEEKKFVRFSVMHMNRITFIVGPLMLLEVVSSVLLLYKMAPETLYNLINVLLLVGIWGGTAVFSIPCHTKLTKEKDLLAIQKLITTNWIRTFLWSLRLLFHVAIYREFGRIIFN